MYRQNCVNYAVKELSFFILDLDIFLVGTYKYLSVLTLNLSDFLQQTRSNLCLPQTKMTVLSFPAKV
jgi:hypothetical protein